MTPTQRTRALLKAEGRLSCIAEHWNQFAHIRQDLFGCIDIVALGPGIRGIQCTTSDHYDHRFKKIIALDAARAWVSEGGSLELWAWGKYGARGKRKTWQAKVHRFILEDFTAELGS